LDSANNILKHLEQSHSNAELTKGEPTTNNQQPRTKNIELKTKEDDFQLSFFKLDDPVLEQIKDEILKTDINTLTPIEALMKLNEIKKLIGG
jgi:DNA mismatch repair protein MutS